MQQTQAYWDIVYRLGLDAGANFATFGTINGLSTSGEAIKARMMGARGGEGGSAGLLAALRKIPGAYVLTTRDYVIAAWNATPANHANKYKVSGGYLVLMNSIEYLVKQSRDFDDVTACSNCDMVDVLGLSETREHEQENPFGFQREDLSNKYYTKRGDLVTMKYLLREFLSGEGPERSLFYGTHSLTQDMLNSAVVQRAKEYYAANYKNGGDMIRRQIDFYVTDIPFASSDIEQFIGSARISIYPRDGYTIFVLDNTTGKYSGGFDSVPDIPRVPGETTPMGNIYQRFIWIEQK